MQNQPTIFLRKENSKLKIIKKKESAESYYRVRSEKKKSLH